MFLFDELPGETLADRDAMDQRSAATSLGAALPPVPRKLESERVVRKKRGEGEGNKNSAAV